MYVILNDLAQQVAASGLNTSATTKIVPVLVLLWTNFCNQVNTISSKNTNIYYEKYFLNKIK